MVDQTPVRDLVAVIDIGSNSVRLVISDLLDLRPSQHLLNEKVMCQLGFGLNTNTNLDPKRRAKALATLAWFAEMCTSSNCSRVLIFATAAIRQADDGPSFVSDVEAMFNVPVQILSGEEEAKASAVGIRASIFGASGIVADLGGGSLEIAKLEDDGATNQAVSLPFGTLILQERVQDLIPKEANKSISNLLRNQLEDQDWLKVKSLYLIGGTWRALALEHIRATAYPLRVVHRYTLSRKEIKAFCKHIVKLDEDDLSDLVSVSPRRREVLREACSVILSLLKATKAKRIVFSSAGVREGFLHSQIDIERKAHPEIQAAADLVVGGARFVDPKSRTIGEELFDWLSPIRAHCVHSNKISDLKSAEIRHLASCHLAEFGWSRHPSYKAEETALMILHSNRLPQSHADRAFLALCLFKRYDGKKMRSITKKFKQLLPKHLRREASVLGLIIRVAMGISTALPTKLAHTSLEKIEEQSFALHMPASWSQFPMPTMSEEIDVLETKFDTKIELRFDL